jgi:ABC-type polysaccharide/polyol phosphate transport system ATPase subunit
MPGGGHAFALKDVSLAIEAGEVTALIGPNGAGKTSVARLLSGCLTPSGGSLQRFSSGYVLSRAVRPGGFGDAAVEWRYLCSRIGLHGSVARRFLEDDTMDCLGRTPREWILTGTRRSQVRLAGLAALSSEQALLISDEELGAPDLEWIGVYQEAARTFDSSLLLVTHALDLVPKVCSRALLLTGGRVADDGPPGEVLERWAERRRRVQRRPMVLPQGDQSGECTRLIRAGLLLKRLRQAKSRRGRWLFRDLDAHWRSGDSVVVRAPDPEPAVYLLRSLAGAVSLDNGALEAPGARALVTPKVNGPRSATVGDMVAATSLRSGRSIGECEQFLGLVLSMEDRVNQEAGTLSSGQALRLAFGLAFLANPGLLLIQASLNQADTDFREWLTWALAAAVEKGTTVVTLGGIELESARAPQELRLIAPTPA